MSSAAKRIHSPPPSEFGPLPFSNGVLVGGTFYMSGHLGVDPWLCANEIRYSALDDHGDCAVPGARISRNCAVLGESCAERCVF